MHSFQTHYQSQKANVLAQATTSPNVTINKYQSEVVDKFTYLGYTIYSHLSFNKEIYRRIGMAASTLVHLGAQNLCVKKSSYSTS